MGYNDIYRLRVHCRMHGGEVLNVMHFRGDLVTSNEQGLADDFRDQMGTTMRGRASNEMFFEFIEVVPLVPYGGGPVTASFPSNTLGSVIGSAASGTIAEVVTIYTSQIGRRHRGRIYLAGAVNNRIVSGSFNSTQVTASQAFVTALAGRYVGDLHTGSYTMGVWSKAIAGPDPPWSTDAFTPATSLTLRTLVRTQRRRQIGVGR